MKIQEQHYGDLADGGNGKLYGLTSKGGIYHMGVIFEWDLINNTYASKFDFAGLSTGAFPCGSLILYNQKFYGLATGGGQNGYGAIFEWGPQTNFFSKKANFSQTTSGAYPYGSLSIKDGKFYGMTRFGGIHNCGVLFEWDPGTNILLKKIDFDDVNTGEMPTNGYLTLYNEKFYGMTFMGGAYHDGVIFEWDPGTNIFTKKVDLETSQGARPLGSLTLKDGKFYGMTHFGGYPDPK
ncbi:MAG: hypothetical protein IPH45_18210 [Bacteroidales bacterium]|nr:hypothetical protein [Bacteroidales bacterium]